MLYKKIIYFLLLSLLIPQISLAQEGKVILDIKEDKESEMIDYIGLYNEYMQELDYFDKKYPDKQINKNFEDDLIELHPDYSDSWTNQKQEMLRVGIKVKRIYDYFKKQIQEFILEDDIPLEYDDDEYEYGDKEEYQETSEPLIIVDIKKAIAYSKSPKDQEAIKEKRAKDLGLQTSYERRQEIKKAILNRDWKKLFSHGLFDGKALDDKRGIGEWKKINNAEARIASIKKYITDKNKIEGIIQLKIPEDGMILRRDNLTGKGINIDFSKSENVKDIIINWPIPKRVFLSSQDSVVGYVKEIDIPFEFTPLDPLKTVSIKADINISICNLQSCEECKLSPILELAPEDPKDNKFPISLVEASINLAHNYSPKEHQEQLNITSLYIETTEQGKQLVANIKYEDDIDFFEIYIEGDGREEFYPPLVVMDNNMIEARFIPISSDIELKNREFSIVASTKEHISIRKLLTPKNNILIKDSSVIRTLKTIVLAFLIGITLNLLPAVLPLWFLNINLFCKFGGTQTQNVKTISLYNMLGIITGSSVLITTFCFCKIFGNNIFVGEQYQNITLVLFSILVVIGIILYARTLPLLPKAHLKYISFIAGAFVILVQVFIPIPYNEEIIGFALLENNTVMILVLLSLSLGVMFPFIGIYAMPELAYPLGNIHKYLKKINTLQYVILWSILFGLAIILSYQTSGHIIWHLMIVFVLIMFIVSLVKQVTLYIQSQNLDRHEYEQAIFKLKLLAVASVLVILISLYIDAFYLSNDQKNNDDCVMPYDKAITSILEKKQNVLLRVTADWCFLCKYNQYFVFDQDTIKNNMAKANIEIIDLDADDNNEEILKLLTKYDKYSLPLYVLYTPNIPSGIALPSNISKNMLKNLFSHLR